MRFHVGKIPEIGSFDPQTKGWSDVWDPAPLLLTMLALPGSFVMLALVIALLSLAWEGGPPAIWTNTGADAGIGQLLFVLVVIGLSIPIHEFLHTLAHPRFGRSSGTILGVWPTRGLFYAHYEGEMPRNRFLLVFALPFVVLSLVPVALVALLGHSIPAMLTWYLTVVALTNGVLSSGDAIGFVLLAAQIPSSAVVRNHGWKTYWKMKPRGPSQKRQPSNSPERTGDAGG